jgi:GT2 family glycosyltransferase
MPLPDKPQGTAGWPWDAPVAAAVTPAVEASLPVIGIVVPSFNQGQFLEATLRSLLLQGYPQLRIVVLDGGSRDGSVEILQRYAPWLQRWVSEPDGGQSDAIQRGLGELSCEVAGWLNSDDLLLPGALLRVGRHFAGHPGCAWLSGDGVFVAEDGRTEQFVQRAAAYDFDDLLDYGAGRFLPQPSVFFMRELFQRVGGVDEKLRYAMDLDLWLRMRARAPLCYLPASLSLLRQHSEEGGAGIPGRHRGCTARAWKACWDCGAGERPSSSIPASRRRGRRSR